MAKKLFSIGDEYGSWTLIKRIPGGGNGSIWDVKNSEGDEKVIKLLRKTHNTAKKRFIDEVKIMIENSGHDGIVEILDNGLLEIESDTLWYVMDKGVLLQKKLLNATTDSIIKAIIVYARTLTDLHSKTVSHRDVKPQNLLYINDKYKIGDFGLVDYPEKEEGGTLSGAPLGPRFTIAPEMRNNPEESDGIKADVFSLSKTLWILLTGVARGFEGQYAPTGSVGLINYQPAMYIGQLDELLVKSTENDPDLRPNMNEFADALDYWLECNEDYTTRNELDWITIQERLFPTAMPTRVVWEDLDTIISILNVIGGIDNLNHMMFPDGGGMDLEGAERSNEEKCIELNCGLPYVLKPKRLIFEGFGVDHEWNYFRLEVDELKPTFESYGEYSEEVSEIEPSVYKEHEFIENYYSANGSVPSSWRQLTRCFKGAFVIFRKTSSYNSTPETYDGRHDKVDMDGFKNYIQRLIDSKYQVVRVDVEEGYKVKKYQNGPMINLDD